MANTRLIMRALIASAAVGAAVLGFTRGRDATVDRTHIDVTVARAEPAFDARLQPLSPAGAREFRIPITHRTVEIAPGVKYDGWTFGNTVPGPVIRVRQGDLVRVTLVNESDMPHSIDLHAARMAMNVSFRTVAPGEELEFEFVAKDPGAYMVHGDAPARLMYIMQGMYLPIIVDPKDGWGTRVDREFVLVQSEFYVSQRTKGVAVPAFLAAQATQASYVVFNGRANRYQNAPLEVELGDRVRFFVVNAGPGLRSDFHVAGAVFDRAYPDGNPRNVLTSVQAYAIPAGRSAVFETEFRDGEIGEGMYVFVTHSFGDAIKGAADLIRVGQAAVAAGTH